MRSTIAPSHNESIFDLRWRVQPQPLTGSRRKASGLITVRSKAACEILAGLFLLFGYMWYIFPLYRTYWLDAVVFALIFGLLLWSRLSRGESCRQLGYRCDNLLPSGTILLAATAAFLLLLSTIWARFFPVNLDYLRGGSFWLKLGQYFVWASIQQYIAIAFFFRRLQELFRPRHRLAILCTAAVFSAMHLPNPILVILTFVGGLFWAWVYHKRPNLITIALSHAIVGVVVGKVLLAYTIVGPLADVRLSRQLPAQCTIDALNETQCDRDDVVEIAATSGEIVVSGRAESKDAPIDGVLVRFNGNAYPADYDGRSRYRAAIPLQSLTRGHHRLWLRVALKGRRLHHRPRYWVWVHVR